MLEMTGTQTFLFLLASMGIAAIVIIQITKYVASASVQRTALYVQGKSIIDSTDVDGGEGGAS